VVAVVVVKPLVLSLHQIQMVDLVVVLREHLVEIRLLVVLVEHMVILVANIHTATPEVPVVVVPVLLVLMVHLFDMVDLVVLEFNFHQHLEIQIHQ
tara:strand:+ start:283 stop:570 length:288 start_codon:yes stop_codon:yes gene_type:complete